MASSLDGLVVHYNMSREKKYHGTKGFILDVMPWRHKHMSQSIAKQSEADSWQVIRSGKATNKLSTDLVNTESS
jgi:hypothetical protein